MGEINTYDVFPFELKISSFNIILIILDEETTPASNHKSESQKITKEIRSNTVYKKSTTNDTLKMGHVLLLQVLSRTQPLISYLSRLNAF